MDETLKRRRYFDPGIETVRFFLIVCGILYTYGFYGQLGDLNGVLLGFSFPALFVISGFVVLRESKNKEIRIIRTIVRTLICFVILSLVYFALSYIVDKSTTLTLVADKSFWVNFLVFNICKLPIGSTIWFVQSLLYAYIIVYIIYKLHLIKIDIFLAVLCLCVTLFSGELSSLFDFNIYGHTYFGGNFLTRALPYILIGSFIARKSKYFSKFSNSQYLTIGVIGIAMTIIEYVFLMLSGNKTYVGHLLGMGLVAISVSLITIFNFEKELNFGRFIFLSRFELSIPFYLCSPIYYCILRVFKHFNELFEYFGNFIGILTLLISISVLYLYSLTRYRIIRVIEKKKWKSDNDNFAEEFKLNKKYR